MINSIQIVSKLIEFVLTKIAGKNIDLALDQRKKGAKAFLKLYEALELLEISTLEFINQYNLGKSTENQRIFYRVPIEKIIKDVDLASDTFFKTFEDLKKLISIYDEQLFQMLWGIRSGKKTILNALLGDFTKIVRQDRLKVTSNPQSVFYVDYSITSTDLLDINFEDFYQQVGNYEIEANIYNSLTSSLFSCLAEQSNFTSRFSDNDEEGIIQFVEMLETHVKFIRSARRKLAEFIKENFTFEDLLYFDTSLRRR